jgi:hypothetical protein
MGTVSSRLLSSLSAINATLFHGHSG